MIQILEITEIKVEKRKTYCFKFCLSLHSKKYGPIDISVNII